MTTSTTTECPTCEGRGEVVMGLVGKDSIEWIPFDPKIKRAQPWPCPTCRTGQ